MMEIIQTICMIITTIYVIEISLEIRSKKEKRGIDPLFSFNRTNKQCLYNYNRVITGVPKPIPQE